MAKRLLFILSLCITTQITLAQTGPGGVGSSSTNVVWLKADEISGLTNGDDVLTWSDASGNSNTFSQPTSSLSPIYQTGVLNGLPVVRFNRTNDRIRRTSFTGFPTSAITVIYVNSTTDSGDGTISYASTASNNDFLLFRSENLNVYRGPNRSSGVSFNDGLFHIAAASWQSSGGNLEVWKDGTRSYTSSGFRSGTSITAGGSMAIAGEQDSEDGNYESGQSHSGDFSEVIVFNTFLNQAQQIIVTNYLSSKYGLTIANDRYGFESTHVNDIAGIGREDVSNTHTSATSADILNIQNASGLDADQEYLLFGHDDGDATSAWTTTEAPNGGVDVQRLAREWRLDETGDVGTVDFVVETSAMPTLPVGHTMYALMVDADGDFSSGASVYEMTLSAGTEYTVTGIEIADGDYVAIAAVEPTIQHTLTSSSGDEGSNATIQVEINFIPETNKTVDVTTANGTATAGDDYTALTSSTVTITAPNTSTTYTVTIDDDSDAESNETFTATLSNPSSGVSLGTNTVHTYSIEDNDISRKVYFDLASSSGSETTTSVNIGVSLSAADMSNPTSVDYSVTGGTAEGSGTDFTLAAGTVNFAAGVTTGNINVSINNETLFENDETIIITLGNPSNANLDNTMPFAGTGFIEHTYTITNDDTSPTIQFNSTSGSGLETTTNVAIQVDISVISGADASASYTLSGTATGGGTDYTLADGTVTVTAGNTSTNINAIITNDIVEELSETMILTLSAPTNASLGTNTVFTYTIQNTSAVGITGPGGVGQSSTNVLWLRPEELATVSDGTDITTWSDNSGNSHDMTQANTSFTPRYYGSIINGFPVVRFEQANGRMVRQNFNDFPSTAITTVYVNRTSDSEDATLSYASSATDNDFLLFRSNTQNVFIDASSTASSVSFNDNSFHVGQVNWQSSDGALSIWKDGSEDYTATFQSSASITAGGTLALAGEQDGINSSYDNTQNHTGDFAEVIIYNFAFNTTYTVLVQNYLAAKYGLTLASNDIYVQDDVSNGNFDYEVAGIGRVNSSDLHQDAQGSGIVRMNDAQDLGDEEFLLWGHDNAALNGSNTDVPIGLSRRFERVWRVSEVNRSGGAVDVGSVDISFDLTGLGNVDVNDLVLLVDADGTFATGATQVTGAVDDGSNVYRFNDVTALTDGMRFTLATLDNVDTPLPVELISFSAGVDNNRQVTLHWSTASETNNSHFSVERSTDGRSFESIGLVAGNGDSDREISYSFSDINPVAGRSFYRLRQVDFNGEFEYTEILTVWLDQVAPYFKVYPNPVEAGTPLLVEWGAPGESIKVKLTDLGGKTAYAGTHRPDGGISTINTQGLSPGTYLLRVSNGTGQSQAYRVIIR